MSIFGRGGQWRRVGLSLSGEESRPFMTLNISDSSDKEIGEMDSKYMGGTETKNEL